MKLSVIIPVYNAQTYLDGCLKSVFEQRVDDLEVLLIDDGSTDGSGEMCNRYAQRYPETISVIHQTNRGLSAARNAGLDRATGDVITFLDADDRVGIGTWGDNMKFLTIYPDVDMVEFPIREYEGSPQERLLDFTPQQVTKAVFNDWIIRRGYEHCYACNKLYRARLWRTRRFPVGQVFEDTAVMPSVVHECNGIFYSSKGCYHYFTRRGSISNTPHYANYRQLYINNCTLLTECTKRSALTHHLKPLRRACLNRLVDMGRCRDCNHTDYHRHLARLSAFDRLFVRLRVFRSPKL